ncbi:DUF1302 domain-containing protein [Nitrogeniibacter mangrovi]|uniref:DUF1302 domain-containing protein n=2 Tax=Nitrogeniibacter mangrovi TaxID=2016596 RepID=A0A6C1B7U4_9RHOO|nr:DUF1302 domain-containing protein [Nitrogeniibacter mangrovi]
MKLCAALVAAAWSAQVLAAGLPAMGEGSDPWKFDVLYDNHTAFRGKDATGHAVGLAKFRNTLTVEADKKLEGDWKFHGILRGTFDGVYRMNKSQFGDEAGGPVMLESTAFGTYQPHGGGFINSNTTAPGTAFNFDVSKNPNEGMRLLGDRWHSHTSGDVTFGVPVRPCDKDSRGCKDFGGYGDLDQNELEMPEFNDRLDFIREAHVRKNIFLDNGKSVYVKLGKQQVVWGRTDLFRVLDVINPVDYSRNNIYDELEDIRIPMWIATAEYRMGPSESMQDRNLQVVWNFDKFRPNNLGQCGQPNVILDASCFFRGMVNLWDNGGTVANFAPNPAGGLMSTDFGPGQIGIRDVHLPDWKLSNTQLGVKYEGVTQGGISFSLNALTYRSQLPSLHALRTGAQNPFTTGPQTTANTNLIAFDVYYPRVNLIGGSMDFESETLGAAIRLEGALTNGEEFPDSTKKSLYSKHKVWRSVIGIDRPTFIPWINPRRTTLISAQLFWQHIFDHTYYKKGERVDPNGTVNSLGPVGMVDWEDNFIGTLLIKAFLMNDRLSPELIIARDFRARAHVIAPKVEWSITDKLKLTFGANFKGGSNSRNRFDDCRTCNPYPPFTAAPGQAPGYSLGLASAEPLGRFRAGPIGTAMYEDDVFFQMRYKF